MIQYVLNYFIASKCIKSGDPETHKYEFSNEDYILSNEIMNYIQSMVKDGLIPDQEYRLQDLISLIGSSGLMQIAVDENHFPPLFEIGLELELIEMIKFCIGVYEMERKKSVTLEELSELIHNNIDNFMTLGKIFQKPIVKKEALVIITDIVNENLDY
jgi:hypothetical protein